VHEPGLERRSAAQQGTFGSLPLRTLSSVEMTLRLNSVADFAEPALSLIAHTPASNWGPRTNLLAGSYKQTS